MNRFHALAHKVIDPVDNWWMLHLLNETQPAETSQEFNDKMADLLDRPSYAELEQVAAGYHNDAHIWRARAEAAGWKPVPTPDSLSEPRGVKP
jgi:hypothetical protein